MAERPLDAARDLLTFLDASPSPYHVVATAIARLEAAGFTAVDSTASWPAAPGGRYLAQGGSLVAWFLDDPAELDHGFRIVGAHADSPNLRIKPQPDTGRAGHRQLGVEVYGGALWNSWLDRDLGLSGRVALRGARAATNGQAARAAGSGQRARAAENGRGTRASGGPTNDPELALIKIDRPLLRIPQLAIHLDRGVNENGLKLNPQQHLVPTWGLGRVDEHGFRSFLADELGVGSADVLAWDVMVHDLSPASLLGRDDEFVSSARLDNQLSCWAALTALTDTSAGERGRGVPVVCLFDHEEIGSDSATGAGGPRLATTLERIVLAAGRDREDHLRAMAASTCVSADGAHATHPNYADRHESAHQIALNGGPVIKFNANVRYATDAASSAFFQLAAERAGVPVQQFVVRTDLACGSTIGPITAARLGIPVVDVGVAQLSMHSARELCGSADPLAFARVLSEYLSSYS